MKVFPVCAWILLLSGIYSFGEEDAPQSKIDQAYEAFKSKPIDQEALKEVQSLSSSELYIQVLKASPSPSRWKEMRVMTLKKRQKDLILEIRKTLNEFPLTIDTMGKLTSLASLVSPEFEAEIANEILQHPSSREFDVYFVDSEDFRNHFRSEPELLRSALKMLLSEDRIGKNSATHKRWEASISKFDRIQEQRAPTTQATSRQSSNRPKQKGEERTGVAETKQSNLPGIIAGVFLLVILALLFKVWKGRSAR